MPNLRPHPTILEASKICKRCGYKLAHARTQINTHPQTREMMESNMISFNHPGRDMPVDMHRFLKLNMEPTDLKKTVFAKKGTGEVSMHYKPLPMGGHAVIFHSIRFKKN